jgi:hypothetical protein
MAKGRKTANPKDTKKTPREIFQDFTDATVALMGLRETPGEIRDAMDTALMEMINNGGDGGTLCESDCADEAFRKVLTYIFGLDSEAQLED